MKFRFSHLPSSFKWAITAFLLLASIGFGVAGLQSYERYKLNMEKTIHHYSGDPAEGEMAVPKPYGYLLSVTHVHSFTMPLVFLTVWIGLQGVPNRSALKKFFIFSGALTILLYNGAPYLVRYRSPDWVLLFPLAGIGLFIFFFWPAGMVLYETWFGFKD